MNKNKTITAMISAAVIKSPPMGIVKRLAEWITRRRPQATGKLPRQQRARQYGMRAHRPDASPIVASAPQHIKEQVQAVRNNANTAAPGKVAYTPNAEEFAAMRKAQRRAEKNKRRPRYRNGRCINRPA